MHLDVWVCSLKAGRSCINKTLVREQGCRAAVNNDCLNAPEISDTVIAGCNMGQICPKGQHEINQHPAPNITHPHTRDHQSTSLAVRRDKRSYECVWERGTVGEKLRSKEGKRKEMEHGKEDRRFNNSPTPASFRIEFVPKVDLSMFHTGLLACYPAYIMCSMLTFYRAKQTYF